jgi:pSer/pThr/pTyr-binding forkhead associated (FHA) protein
MESPNTNHIDRNQTGLLISHMRTPIPPSLVISAQSPEVAVSLHLVDSGVILQLSGQNEYSLGRAVKGQSILPDVDLSPYEAYSQGVSRLHAALKLNNHRVFLTDLGSSNGTRVNGQKVMANTDWPLNHGDVVTLGKFKIQVLIRN